MIGAGYFAHFQAEAWQRMPGASIAAVADALPGKAQAFARQYGIPRGYESVAEMLDAEQPHFVDIVTRPETHRELTIAAAARGLHVICQKPMSPCMDDNIAMCEVCEAAGVRLMVHENWRWQPWYREAWRLIQSGVIGSLRHLAFDWRSGDGTGPEPFAAQPYFRDMPRLIIYESLVHILDTFRYLAGELVVSRCQTRRVNPAIAGDDWAEIDCQFASGASGFIHGDRQSGPWPAPVAMGCMEIRGDSGTLRIAADGQVFLNEAWQPFVPPTTGYKGDSVLGTQQHFLECLVSGQPCESDGREYLKTAALVEDCYRLAPMPLRS